MVHYCAGHVNVAPRHLTAESETLLSATLVHEVRWIYGYVILLKENSSSSCPF